MYISLLSTNNSGFIHYKDFFYKKSNKSEGVMTN
jgi:hypothetical protein